MIRLTFGLGFMLASMMLVAQEPALDFDEFMKTVSANHPASARAAVLPELAAAGWLESKGAFDPKLSGLAGAKRFDGKNYYRYTEAGISYQSPFALRAKVGYQTAAGAYLNPMDFVPEAGQFKTELTLPLGKGLLMDEARANYRVAGLEMELAGSERIHELNQLLAAAAYTYWDWIYYSEQRRIYELVTRLSDERREAVKNSFLNGSVPAIDTLEAVIQYQNRLNQLQQALQDERNAVLKLGNYRWTPDQEPDAAGFAVPKIGDLEPMLVEMESMDSTRLTERLMSHPEIRMLAVYDEQLEVWQRLKKEYLKPTVDVSLSLLGEGWRFVGTGGGESLPVAVGDNHVWNISVGFPLFLRAARGGLQQNRIKREQVRLKVEEKAQVLRNKVWTQEEQLNRWRELYTRQKQVAADYRRLWEAEREKFALGKGSLFLINARESQWVESELKAAGFFTEIFKAYVQRQLSLGILADSY